jgi:hypothetical protein
MALQKLLYSAVGEPFCIGRGKQLVDWVQYLHARPYSESSLIQKRPFKLSMSCHEGSCCLQELQVDLDFVNIDMLRSMTFSGQRPTKKGSHLQALQGRDQDTISNSQSPELPGFFQLLSCVTYCVQVDLTLNVLL